MTESADVARANGPTDVGGRLLLPVGILVIVLVVAVTGSGSVGFGTTGDRGALTAAVLVYAAAGIAFLIRPWGLRLTCGLLSVMGVAAALVHHLDPTGPVIGLFLVTAFAPLRLPRTPAVLVAAGSAALFSLVLAVDQPRPLVSVAVVLVGAGFFFLFGTLMRGEREQRLRADDLVRQLEASRAGELRAAAEGERIRLAREIHDVLAHTLSGLIVQLGGARLAAEQPGTDPALREAVVRSHELARAGLAEAREAVSALRGASPGPEAVPDLVAEHEGLSGGPCRLVVEGDPRPLGVEARRAVYRVVQESLSNVRKHAPGADVDVRLTWGSDSVVVEIRDEGGGPDPLPGEGIGAGLDGMRERAALAGGTLEAQRTATGFRVRLCMPVTTGGAR